MAFVSLSTSCYFGDLITVKSFNTSNAAYDVMWYRLPLRLRVHIKLIILFAQQRVHLSGMTVIICSLENFASVC